MRLLGNTSSPEGIRFRRLVVFRSPPAGGPHTPCWLTGGGNNNFGGNNNLGGNKDDRQF